MLSVIAVTMSTMVALLLLLLHAVAAAEEAVGGEAVREEQQQQAEEEGADSLFSTLDYVLLAFIVGVGGWYLLFREKDSYKMPEYEIKPMVAREASVTEKGFISKMRKSGRRLVVFYGSQTGTAEEFAGRLAKEGARYGLKGVVADPEEEDMDKLQEIQELEEELDGPCLAVFMLATYGEGDPTDNAMDFHEKLTADEFQLNGLKFAVFGLGNKTYEHYNAFGKMADEKLEALGGKRIHPLGLGDDDGNLEDDFITWKEAFWASVCQEFNIEASMEDVNSRQYEHKVLAEGEYNPEKMYRGEVARLRSFITQRPPFDMKNPFMATITVNRNLHKEASGRHCMHLELNMEGSRMRYDCGDHVAVYPTNNEELVNRLAELLNIELDTVFTMINVDEDSTKKNPFPCPTTYRYALFHYVDIVALPRTHILKELANYTTEPAERDKLLLMADTTPEGKALYQSWIIDDVRHLTHILEDLPSCKPPVDHVLELLPRLQPRFYSIASSGKVLPNSIHVCGVVVEYKTPTGRTNKGVATTWLRTKEVREGEELPRIPVYVRRSQFRLPSRPQTPIIMIGPGTGLAPFRGFIQERAWQKQQGKQVGPTLLYFGCRNKDADYIYQEELEEWEKEGVLELYTAFSRDQAEKRYVTHLLRETGERLWHLLEEESAHLYVCGDAKMMAKDVRNFIREIFQTYGGHSADDAEKLVKKMETQKRYSADVWS